jgi:hypothetical protein
MPTGYGYVRDSEPLAVDWAAVSKKFTDQLKSQEDERLATKKEILDNRADFQKTLLDRPVGQNTALNNIMSGFANQLSEYSLSNLNQYKGKNKNLQEYNAWENNARSGTELLFDAVESFNKNFDGYAQRAQDGSASQIEVFMHELTQDFTDFGKVSVDVDQKTGEVIISELGEDGKPTGKTLDVSQLGYFSRFTRDKYDINGAIGAVAQNLGTKFLKDSEGRSLQYQGQLYDEIVNNEELMKGLDTEISALIDEGFELESVLADSMNYQIVTNKTDEENKLFFNQDTNQFEITESQKQAAFDHVKQKLMNTLNIDRREPAADKPKDKTRETLDIINTVRLSGGKVPPELFTQLLKDKGLTDEQIAATFPQGVDDDVFNELSVNLENLLTGLTPEILQSGQADKKRDAVTGETAINKELRRLRSIGISAKYDRKNNQILINKLGGKDDDAAPIDLEGKTLTQIYDSIINEIPLYQSIEDIFTLLEFQSATRSRRQGQAPGDVIFNIN